MTKWTKAIPAVLLCEALLAVLMIGCSSSASAQCNDEPEIGRVTFSFVNFADEFGGSIYYCDQTGVLYFADDPYRAGSTTLTMLCNANGLPMTLDQLK